MIMLTEHMIGKLYAFVNWRAFIGWTVFVIFYGLIWDSSITHMMRIGYPLVLNTSPTVPLQRSSLFIIGAYIVCRATLLLCLSLLLLFCLERVYHCLKAKIPQFDGPALPDEGKRTPLLMISWWLQWFTENNLNQPMHPRFLPYHAGVFLVGIAISMVFAIVYPSKKDLESPDAMRSVLVRESCSIAGVGLTAYVGMWAMCSRQF